MSKSFGSDESFASCGRQKATAEMRLKAQRLQAEAKGWLSLANALDSIEREATQPRPDGGEGGAHIGAGSAAEMFLWELATRP